MPRKVKTVEPAVVNPIVVDVVIPVVEKVKKPRSEKQILAFEKALSVRKENIKNRALSRENVVVTENSE